YAFSRLVMALKFPDGIDDGRVAVAWPDAYSVYYARQARALLAGAAVEKLPTPDEVKAGVPAMTEKLRAMSWPELQQYLRRARLPELLVAAKALKSDRELNARLLAVTNVVTEVEGKPETVVRELAKCKGQPLDEAMLDRIAAIMEKELRAGRMTVIKLEHGAGMSGIKIGSREKQLSDWEVPDGYGLISRYGIDDLLLAEYVPLSSGKEKQDDGNSAVDRDKSWRSSGGPNELKNDKEEKERFCRKFRKLFLERGNALTERTLWFRSNLPASVADPR
ncbi:MAG: hypothetical protein PHQ27_11150, partial [Victivallales bacterium]|nr:hypothetical protein [Victivallales bacterium]